MFPPEFIPIVNHGMSIFTAGIFFFMGIGSVFLYFLFKRELQRINTKIESQSKITADKINDTDNKVDLLFSKIDNSNSDIAVKLYGIDVLFYVAAIVMILSTIIIKKMK